MVPRRARMTPREANKLISDVEAMLYRKESLPLSISISWERYGADAWQAATDASLLRSLLCTIGMPGLGNWNDGLAWTDCVPRVVCENWNRCGSNCEKCIEIVRAMSPEAPTLAQLIASQR